MAQLKHSPEKATQVSKSIEQLLKEHRESAEGSEEFSRLVAERLRVSVEDLRQMVKQKNAES